MPRPRPAKSPEAAPIKTAMNVGELLLSGLVALVIRRASRDWRRLLLDRFKVALKKTIMKRAIRMGTNLKLVQLDLRLTGKVRSCYGLGKGLLQGHLPGLSDFDVALISRSYAAQFVGKRPPDISHLVAQADRS